MPNPNCKKCHGTGEYRDEFIPIAGGSMGLGLPGAVGLALAKKLKGEGGHIYVLMSDGEMATGTTWESALIATEQKLGNLTVIVDNNRLQAMGPTSDILQVSLPIQFPGWRATSIDGHNYKVIEESLHDYFLHYTLPKVVVANTVKGKGWTRAEGNNLYHYKAPSEEEYWEAKKELEYYGRNPKSPRQSSRFRRHAH